MSSIEAKRRAFAELHTSGCFLIPNPWDVGTARYLERCGFKALATTSAGFGFSRGQPDAIAALSLQETLAHAAEIVAATALPVSVDFQDGYAASPDELSANVRACIETGVAGLSIEDATGVPGAPLYELDAAVERVRAARAAIDSTGARVLLTARAESYLVGHPAPLEDVLRRLCAYAEAGADVLFAPGPRTLPEIAAIVAAVAPKPVNAIVTGNIGLSVADLAQAGVRRISVGSALARVAWGALIRSVEELRQHGTFKSFEAAASFAQINSFFDSPAPPEGS